MRDGKPYSEGLIRADAKGEAVLRLENTGDPTKLAAFAVSFESTGGSKDRQTHGPLHYVASTS